MNLLYLHSMKSWLLVIFSLLIHCCSLLSQDQIVVFDKGGVLTRQDYSTPDGFLQETLHISKKEVDEAIKEKHEQKRSDKNLTDEEFWHNYAKKRGISLSKHWFKLLRGLYPLSPPHIEVLALVEELAVQDYRLGLLSNTTKEAADFNRMIGYYNYFDPCLLSCEIGISKPDKQAFKKLISTVNLKPDQIIFIDDDEANVTAAKSCGIDAIHFKDAKELRRELRSRGFQLHE